MRDRKAVRFTYRWVLGNCLMAGCAWLADSCSGAHEPAQHSPDVQRPLAIAIKPTTNVPRLLGRSIEELRQRLGSPQQLPAFLSDARQYDNFAPRHTDSLMVFRTGGLTMVASYDIRTRHVNDLLMLGRHEDSLMQRSALRADAANYLVIPVFHIDRPGRLLGLRVVPAKR